MNEAIQQDQGGRDEIDLVDLISNLWKEKLVIAMAILLFTAYGIFYALNQPSVYRIKAQLTPPQESQLGYLNNTKVFNITPEEAFKEFLTTLENNNHIVSAMKLDPTLTQDALGFSDEEGLVSKVNNIRNVEYLSAKKQQNEITPDKYVLTLEGLDKNALKKLLEADLDKAEQETVQLINQQYLHKLSTAIRLIDNKINARKSFLLATQKDHLAQLENALSIAKELEIELPTSLNKLGLSQALTEIKINNTDTFDSLLYLRGTKLLAAEINNLKKITDQSIFDSELRRLEAEKGELNGTENISDGADIEFYTDIFDIPEYPIKPNRKLTVAVYLLIGSMIGSLIAILKIVYRKSKG